jgi:oligopeptidase B
MCCPACWTRLAWANDNRTLFYIQQDPVTLNNGPVMAHRLGRVAESADRQVFEEADRTRFVTLHRSASGRKVRIAVDDYDSSETWALNADAPAAPPRRVLARRARCAPRCRPLARPLVHPHQRKRAQLPPGQRAAVHA